MIQGHGASNPVAMFIADGGQGEDLKTNYALTGYQESLLVELCRDSGLNLKEFWRTALIKEEVTKSEDWSSKYVVDNMPKINTYYKVLIDEINTLKPNLLIPLGELSFHFLTRLSSIRKFRGSVLPIDPLYHGINNPHKVLPILGPYPYLYQDQKQKYITRIDFQKIKRNYGPDPIPEKRFNIWVCRSSGALRAFIDRNLAANPRFLVFDLEFPKGILNCISLCFDGIESICVPILDRSVDFDSRVLMLDQVARLLASDIPKVNQNIKADWKICDRWNMLVRNVVGDTMLASSVIYCEFPANLGFLTSIYTDLPYFKDEGKEFIPSLHQKDQFYLYNAKDSLATHQIMTKQADELDEQGVRGVYEKLVSLIPVYKQMEANGIRIDEEQRLRLLAKYQSLYRIHVNKLTNLLSGGEYNPLSWKQMDHIIYDVLRYKRLRNSKTDEDSLMLLRILGEASAAPSTGPLVVDEIIACRKIHKVIEILELAQYPDGRFRGETNLAGTETGRSTGGKSLDELLYFDEKGKTRTVRLGHSLQTIGKHGFSIDGVTYGKDIRSMFVPSFGYTFVECDLSQAEARVDAVLANNFKILEIFDGPIGIHRLTGSWAYNCNPEEIRKGTLVNGIDRYHVAKQVRHSGERNITAEGLVTKFLWGTSLSEGRRLLDAFHKFQPEIRGMFHRDIIHTIDATRVLIAPNGRRRDFFDRITRSTYNEGFSFLPQAIVSDQTKFSLLKTTDDFRSVHLLTEAHDGVLAEVRSGTEMEYITAYKRNIETPIDFRKCSLSRDYSLVIPCEASISKSSWYEMEEVEV